MPYCTPAVSAMFGVSKMSQSPGAAPGGGGLLLTSAGIVRVHDALGTPPTDAEAAGYPAAPVVAKSGSSQRDTEIGASPLGSCTTSSWTAPSALSWTAYLSIVMLLLTVKFWARADLCVSPGLHRTTRDSLKSKSTA